MKKSENFKELKRLCKEYVAEGKEKSPDYGAIAMDLANAAVNYMAGIGEIKL